MFKLLNSSSTFSIRSILLQRIKYNFSSSSDPYYILGVDKGAQFKQIKKSFFKLANEYHPDKNDTIDGKKKFLIIKQAFQQIKMQKGLMKPQNFVDNTGYNDSVRPNPDQFSTDESQSYKTNRDYKIFNQKANSHQKYSQFNSSFKTIHDINDIKIKVQQGQMKDSSSRFNLQSMRAKITARPQSSLTVVIIGMAGLFIILSIINDAFQGNQQTKQKQKIITSNQFIKAQSIQSEKEKAQKRQLERQKKVKHQQLLKIINQSKPKQSKKQFSSVNLNQKNAWAKLVEKNKQEFITNNQNVI